MKRATVRMVSDQQKSEQRLSRVDPFGAHPVLFLKSIPYG